MVSIGRVELSTQGYYVTPPWVIIIHVLLMDCSEVLKVIFLQLSVVLMVWLIGVFAERYIQSHSFMILT